MKNNLQSLSGFIWSVADILRGDFKQSQYGRVILPFTVLRRLEAVLEDKKDKVVKKSKTLKSMKEDAKEKILKKEAGEAFYNTSELNLSNISTKDPLADIESYLNSFSKDVREIFENFKFSEFLGELDRADILFPVIQKYKEVDLSPSNVSNYDMGLVFEDLIRRFAESSNETAGEHFTPRDMVRLTTSLVFLEDDEALTKKGVIRHLYDPTCGTGGFLSSGMEYLFELNKDAQLIGFGQELNPESYAICKADMLIKGQDVSNIKLGNTLSDDQLTDKKFDYLLSNPPFGVDWKKTEKQIKNEHKKDGYKGRFGPGLPRVSDGSLLFLLHLISKMRPVDKNSNGSRIGIILNGSPLFTGNAGSGESEIRRFLIENDLVEAIVEIPKDMFFNTDISTYIWVLSNNKSKRRKGKIQLVDASNVFERMEKSLGKKKKYLSEDQISLIVKAFGEFNTKDYELEEGKAVRSKVFENKKFGHRRITIERPLKLSFHPKKVEFIEKFKDSSKFKKLDNEHQSLLLKALENLEERYNSGDKFLSELKLNLDPKVKIDAALKKSLNIFSVQDDNGELVYNKENILPNPELREYEVVPLEQKVVEYFEKEVKPHYEDAWIDTSKVDSKDGEVGVIGYELSFNQHFFNFTQTRSLKEIDKDLDSITNEIQGLLKEVHT